jgi:hypothetical protein
MTTPSSDSAVVLDRRAASEFLTVRGYRVAYATLAKLAVLGGGPPFRHWGRRPLYRPEDLLAWAAAKTTAPKRSTSEAAAGAAGAQAV